MSERFKELPREKQLSILRAATEVFARYEYKKASTDLIASKAGVSKGLLFYYFQNKRDLYLTVHEYVQQKIGEGVADFKLLEITDFFEFISCAIIKKFRLFIENPYIAEFSVRSFYSDKEEVSDALKEKNSELAEQSYQHYFNKIDFTKFKENINPYEIYKMLFWLTDGYIHEKQMNHEPLCFDVIEKVYANWIEMFREISYKEEYV